MIRNSDSINDEGIAPVRTLNIALLGCGVVGREVARLLIDDRGGIQERTGIDFQLQRILVRDCNKDRGIDHQLFTDHFEDILRADVDVVIEVLGGLDPAASFLRQLLANGVNVITANKSLIACHGEELEQIAAESGTILAYEASVGAAVPVIAALKRLAGDRVRSITGIVNGSCNYILSRMTKDAISFDEALIEAKELGLVEPDPSADVSGRDSAEKLAVLCAVAGFGRVSPSEISTRGIESISREDIAAARRRGCVIKLLATARVVGDQIIAEVGPAFVPRGHPLASVHLENNAFLIESDLGGELLLQGKGAGPRPTAAAILGDLVQCAGSAHAATEKTKLVLRENRQAWYVRLACDSRRLPPQRLLDELRSRRVEASEIGCTNDQATFVSSEASLSQIEAAASALQPDPNRKPFIARQLRNSTPRGRLVLGESASISSTT